MDGLFVSMIIIGVFGILIAALGLFMAHTGRGSFLIAGFNTMSKEEKSKYDSRAICKFIGKFLIAIGVLTVLFAVGLTLGVLYSSSVLWITIIAFCVIVAGSSLFVVIRLNSGSHFRK